MYHIKLYKQGLHNRILVGLMSFKIWFRFIYYIIHTGTFMGVVGMTVWCTDCVHYSGNHGVACVDY